jgi:hypothetical protein
VFSSFRQCCCHTGICVHSFYNSNFIHDIDSKEVLHGNKISCSFRIAGFVDFVHRPEFQMTEVNSL